MGEKVLLIFQQAIKRIDLTWNTTYKEPALVVMTAV